jgi:hypothetical protein
MRAEIDYSGLPADMAKGFAVFHRDNPHVFSVLVTRTRTLLARGHKRVGMKMLFETLRWDHMLKTDGREPFKLNNNYTAFYSRFIEGAYPELKGVYTKRGSAADE